MNNHLISIRNSMNKKRPHFYKQGSLKKSKIEKKWRKARGADSKVKRKYKGRQPRLSQGYRGPAEVRGLSRDGLNIVLANNINNLKNVNKSKDIVCLASIGMKKKIEVVKECVKMGLKLMNVKDPQKFLSDNEQDFNKRKEEKTKRLQEKTKKVEEKKEGKKEKGIEEKIGKEEEKKEKDKVLIKRDI